MKKISVFLLAILAITIVSILFISCGEPEAGVYKPKKKISKVYYQVGQTEELAEEWEWDGNKVSFITYYHMGSFNAKDEFIYEGNKLIKIRDDQGYYAEYIYNDEQFEMIKCYDPVGVLLIEITFQYNEKKISTFTVLDYGMQPQKNAINMIKRGFMGKLLSEEGMEIVAKKLANHTKVLLEFHLSYEGDNISSIKIGYENITYLDYDTHSNVWYNFFPFFYEGLFSCQIFSKNNPGKEIIYNVNTMGSTLITNYHYTYDDDCPITIQTDRLYMDETDTLSSAYKTRIEYK